jgi:hypothetical protein
VYYGAGEMSDEHSVRHLQNRAIDTSPRADVGSSHRVTWVPRERVIASLDQADPALARELAETLPDTVDGLYGSDVACHRKRRERCK